MRSTLSNEPFKIDVSDTSRIGKGTAATRPDPTLPRFIESTSLPLFNAWVWFSEPLTLNGCSDGRYTVQEGSLNTFKPGKMVWTKAENGILAPFYLPDKKQEVNVIACEGLKDEC